MSRKTSTKAKETEAQKVRGEVQEAPVTEEQKAAGFIKEISDKINAAQSMADLEALQGRVYDIWADQVPAEIQDLAAKKGEEIEKMNPLRRPPKPSKQSLQKDWKKVTMEEVKAAEKAGKLRGFDNKDMTADIAE